MKESNMILRIVLVSILLCASNLLAAIKTQPVEYKQGDTVLKGYLAWDDSTTAKRPAVIVVHEWWGNNDYSHKRAEMLAELGYVGFAIDMYGDGRTTTEAKQAGEWATQIQSDMKLGMARAQAAIDVLKAQPMVDQNKLAAIGYCFGGGVVLHMARANLPILGVVSFHGSLATDHPENTKDLKPKVLVCHGAEDTFVSQEEVAKFIDEMRRANADWQFNYYSGAIHAFTNPDADKFGIKGIAYNKEADQRSWQAMKNFLKELFGQ
jgi:dienelactone hydrolase